MIKINLSTRMTSSAQNCFEPKKAANTIFSPIIKIQYSRTCPLLNLRKFYPKLIPLKWKKMNVAANTANIMRKIVNVAGSPSDWMERFLIWPTNEYKNTLIKLTTKLKNICLHMMVGLKLGSSLIFFMYYSSTGFSIAYLTFKLFLPLKCTAKSTPWSSSY